jgi:hypothetical protein
LTFSTGNLHSVLVLRLARPEIQVGTGIGEPEPSHLAVRFCSYHFAVRIEADVKNQVQLITYVDRLCGDLKELKALLRGPLAYVFGGVHLLPFFNPIDGADAGFDPTDHTEVDPRLGDWDDVRALGEHVEVVADLIVNHISTASPQFQDFSRNGAKSPLAGLFLTYDRVFPMGACEADPRHLVTGINRVGDDYYPAPSIFKRLTGGGHRRIRTCLRRPTNLVPTWIGVPS